MAALLTDRSRCERALCSVGLWHGVRVTQSTLLCEQLGVPTTNLWFHVAGRDVAHQHSWSKVIPPSAKSSRAG